MSDEERARFNEEWPHKLHDGGWICATWPKEYGGKGLSTMEGVVLAEEFARAKAPMRADFFGDTLVGPTILQWGSEEQKQEFLPKILRRRDALVPGLQRAELGLRPGQPEDVRRARRRRVGDQRPEGVDDRRPPRRLLLPARPAPTPTRRSTRASPTCSCRCASPASRCAASPSPTGRPSSARSSSTTPAARRTTSSAASTTGGRWPTRRWRSSGASRRRPATAASRRSTARWSRRPRANGAHRRPAHPPAPGGVLDEDPDPALQRAALADGDRVKGPRTPA